MNNHFNAIGFYEILEKLKEHALSDGAKAMIDEMQPFLNENICRRKLALTGCARKILDVQGNPPLPPMKNLLEIITMADAGMMLLPEQLLAAAQFSTACRRMTSYLKRGESVEGGVGIYGRAIEDLSDLQEEIERCVNFDGVNDDATPVLRGIRRDIERNRQQIKEKLEHILQSKKQYLADGYISVRAGKYVLPVQRKFQKQFGGKVIELSGKGGTVFMQPDSIEKLQSEADCLSAEEERESEKVLYSLSALVSEKAEVIRQNIRRLEELDFLFAKAKLSAAMNGREAAITGESRLKIVGGRHPMLGESCVPLNIEIDTSTVGVIITGPNTGGKTVAIKTVGLLCLMTQCGLHIPCDEGTVIPLRDGIFCDIGDSQSISQNLSTFSGQMTNVISILNEAGRDSLVLMDELGGGTDPAEGMGIAIAVLEELRRRGCIFMATTHYARVKDYAERTENVMTARMAFDSETLRPLYRLEMGVSGVSCALHIAKRLGLAEHILARASFEVYGGEMTDGDKMMKFPKSRLQRTDDRPAAENPTEKFSMGDSVVVKSSGVGGIVYRPADKNGDVVVQIKGEKLLFRHDRIALRLPAAELYPPDYDFSIIFDTVENRKARHILERKHQADVSVTVEREEYKRGDR